jgi:NAD-dependent DNA ligase
MRDILDRASKMYYLGTPIMSDAEFDILAAHFKYNTVGHQVTDGIPHFYRMYSLQNCFDLADSPLDLKDCIVTPKLDGAAVSILYIGGDLSLALTRGDGKLGRDITEKMECLVPNTIHSERIIQINGEVVAPKDTPNSRNVAAGALNLKDLNEFKNRSLTFIAYDMEEKEAELYQASMTWLWGQGFTCVTSLPVDKYPTDGEVYRINDNTKFKEMGYTSHHPRGAFAFKEQQQGVVTTLKDVIWQVGKSGVVSPVAILEPVDIEEATVSRSTLHNMDYIDALNLEIGCQVEVIRSGKVIPRVVRRV